MLGRKVLKTLSVTVNGFFRRRFVSNNSLIFLRLLVNFSTFPDSCQSLWHFPLFHVLQSGGENVKLTRLASSIRHRRRDKGVGIENLRLTHFKRDGRHWRTVTVLHAVYSCLMYTGYGSSLTVRRTHLIRVGPMSARTRSGRWRV